MNCLDHGEAHTEIGRLAAAVPGTDVPLSTRICSAVEDAASGKSPLKLHACPHQSFVDAERRDQFDQAGQQRSAAVGGDRIAPDRDDE